MGNVIVALPKLEDAKNISNILKRFGLETDSICSTAGSTLYHAHKIDNGIVICGAKLLDMHYTEVLEQLPDTVEMLLIASSAVLANCPSGVTALQMPFKGSELAATVEAMLSLQYKRYHRGTQAPRKRTSAEQKVIDEAKILLMERKAMTEQEAFRYIQKCSMDSGTNMVESAQMVLSLMQSES